MKTRSKTLIAATPPPRGGLLLCRFPHEEPGGSEAPRVLASELIPAIKSLAGRESWRASVLQSFRSRLASEMIAGIKSRARTRPQLARELARDDSNAAPTLAHQHSNETQSHTRPDYIDRKSLRFVMLLLLQMEGEISD